MKHLILINKHAGKIKDIEKEIKRDFEGLDYEVKESSAPRSFVHFLREYFAKEKDLVRVYACGGDGTLHEVVNGLIGVKNAELALYACGTGNDFAKVYGGRNNNLFLDFKKLQTWKASPIDISKVESSSLKEPWYSINVVNLGFDAMVGAKGNINKLKGKKNPYGFANAIVPALISGRFNNTVIKLDGKQLNKKKLLLASISQGQFIGGEYNCSPRSDNTDGLIDVTMFKCMSLIRLMIQYYSKYHDGLVYDSPKLMKRVVYTRAKDVEVIAPKDIDVCVDGEMIRGKEFKVTCLQGAINFVKPE